MNLLKLKTWSERQQVLAVILAAGAVIFGLWFFLLLPFNRERQQLEDQIRKAKSELRRKNYLLDEEILKQKKQEQLDYNAGLRKEWNEMVERVSAFPGLEEFLGPEVGDIIDFKVALFNVRRNLMRKAAALKVILPPDLGMPEEVRSNEDARRLMLQLRTIEKFVEMAFDLRIPRLMHIKPLDPVKRTVEGVDGPFMEEYPVLVEFEGDIETVYDFFQAVVEPRRVFALKHFRVETQEESGGDDLRITAVVSGLSFLRRPEKPRTPETITRRTGPMGY
ncbi:MAG: hypothetical protein R6V03_05290 [Kiritimatiellia bacterium]